MTMRKLFAAIGVFFVVATVLRAVDRSDLLFYAPFDGNLEAGYSRGDRKPTNPSRYRFVNGVVGEGVIAERGITWEGRDNILPDQGTFCFWFTPVDWSTDGKKNRHFANLSTANGAVLIYQYFSGAMGIVMVVKDRRNPRCWIRMNLEMGRWYHLAFTWREGEWILYLDGLFLQQTVDDVLPFGEIERFRLGSADVAVDELLIFRRALTAEEVTSMYYRNKRLPPPCDTTPKLR